MMDVNYFLDQAQNSTQREFELDWADVIQVFDTTQTELITEDDKELIIYWYSDGSYQGYQVIVDNRVSVVDEVVAILKKADVDREMMMEILNQVGMERQMLGALMFTLPYEEVLYEYGELVYARKCKVY